MILSHFVKLKTKNYNHKHSGSARKSLLADNTDCVNIVKGSNSDKTTTRAWIKTEGLRIPESVDNKIMAEE